MLSGSVSHCALAQAGANGAPASKVTLQLFDDLDDIDRLRSLNPLKLTAAQLDKMIAAITAAKEAYDKQIADLAAEQVKAMADEIHDVKRKMLTGGKIPKDFDDKVKKASLGFIAARDKLDADNLVKLADVMHEIFTPEQIVMAIKLSKAAATATNKSTEGADNLWLNYYVKEIIIGYPRMLPLLKEMRDAVSGDAKTAGKNGTGAHGRKIARG
jgi:hypothetical protein